MVVVWPWSCYFTDDRYPEGGVGLWTVGQTKGIGRKPTRARHGNPLAELYPMRESHRHAPIVLWDYLMDMYGITSDLTLWIPVSVFHIRFSWIAHHPGLICHDGSAGDATRAP